MTGNNKVWRASLAGLASVAMLATMGVVAGTANADTVETYKVTYTAENGATISNVPTDTKTRKLDATVLNVVPTISADDVTAPVFTGWYTEAGQWVKPGTEITADTTLVAHWAETEADTYKVTFTGTNFTKTYDGAVANDFNAAGVAVDGDFATVIVAKDDKLSADQVPTDNGIADQKLLKSTWTVTGTKNTEGVDPTSDLSKYVEAETDNNTAASNEITFTAEVADAYTVNFDLNSRFVDGELKTYSTNTFEFADSDVAKQATKDGDNDAKKLSVDVLLGQSYGSVPQVKFSDGKTIDSWAVATAAGKQGDAWTASSSKATKTSVSAYPVFEDAVDSVEVTVNYGYEENGSPKTETKYVEADADLLAALGTPTYPDVDSTYLRYTFDKWTTDAAGQKELKSGTAAKEATTVYANWKVSEVGVKFNPGYDHKAAKVVWFKDGDAFAVPTDGDFARDGYTADWGSYEDPIDYTGKIDQTNKNIVFGDAAKPQHWTVQPGLAITASWIANGVQGLNDALNVIERQQLHVDADNAKRYLTGAEQDVFTADSFDAYITFAKDFYTRLDKYNGSYTVEQAEALTKELNDANAKLVFVNNENVYRAYNGKRHIVTTSWNEYHDLITRFGWWQEAGGVAFKTVDVANAIKDFSPNTSKFDSKTKEYTSGVATLLTRVARLYNAAQDRQHYAVTASEEYGDLTSEQGWVDESDGTQDHPLENALFVAKNGTTPVYRLYIPSENEHLWTTDKVEYDSFAGQGKYAQQENVDFNL